MKIVNLKQEAPEMEAPRPSDYPWGLCLHLGAKELEKLGVGTLPAIGQSVRIAGVAVVVALRQDGDVRSMELQITDLGVDAGRKTAAGKMYPSADED